MKDFAKRLDSISHTDYLRLRNLLMARLGWSRNTFSIRRKSENFSFAELQLLAYTFGCRLEDLCNENYALQPEKFNFEELHEKLSE